MRILKPGLSNFLAYLFVIVEISRDFAIIDVIAVASISGELSSDAASKCEISPAVHDITSPKQHSISSLEEERLEPDISLSAQLHELKDKAVAQSHDASVPLVREDYKRDEEPPRNGKAEIADIPTQNNEGEEFSPAARSSSSGGESSHPSSGQHSNSPVSPLQFQSSSAPRSSSSEGERTHRSAGKNHIAQDPYSPFYPSQFSNMDYTVPHQMNSPVSYPHIITDTDPYQSLEWRLHWLDVLQPKVVYEPQKQLHYLPVLKGQTPYPPRSSFGSNNNEHLQQYHVGGPVSSRFSRIGWRRQKPPLPPRLERLREKNGRENFKTGMQNRYRPKGTHLANEVLQLHPAESSGSQISPSSSEFYPDESKRPLNAIENSPKESLTVSQQDRTIDLFYTPKTGETAPESSSSTSTKKNHGSQNKIEETESITTKTSALEAHAHATSDNLEEQPITHNLIPTPEALNSKSHRSPTKDKLNDLTEKENLVGAEELLTPKSYQHDPKAPTNDPSVLRSDSHLPESTEKFVDEQATKQPTARNVSPFQSDSTMEPSRSLEIISQKSSSKNREKENSNSKRLSEARRRKTSKANPVVTDKVDKSTSSQPRNKFKMLDDLDKPHQDDDHEEEIQVLNHAQDNNNAGRLEMLKVKKKKIYSARQPSLNSNEPATDSKTRQDYTGLLNRVKPYFDSAKGIVLKAWDKKTSLGVGITSLMPSSLSVKQMLQTMWGARDQMIPLRKSLFNILNRPKAQTRQPLQIKTTESPRIKELEKNPRTGLQNQSDEKRKGKNQVESFEDPLPAYVHDYLLVHPGAKKREIDLVHKLGKFLRLDSKEPLPKIQLSTSDPDYDFMLDFLNGQKNAEEPGGKQIRWLFKKLGDAEGKRRWKAIIRQNNQPKILRKWQEIGKENLISPKLYNLLDRTLHLSEPWPTCFGSSHKEFEMLQEYLNINDVKKAVIDVLGQSEFEFRIEQLMFLSYRLYPHDWLTQSEAEEAYQQGLNTTFIILIGDLLQFGRKYFTIHATGGIPGVETTSGYLLELWRNAFQAPWGSSAEKAWFLSQPERAKIYEERMTYLKDVLKYHFSLAQVMAKVHENFGVSGVQWWSPSDHVEWAEYLMDRATMVRIGRELNMDIPRNKSPDLEKLKKILKKEKLSKGMEETIYKWFKSTAYSPYTRSDLVPTEDTLAQSFSRKAEDFKSLLSSIWRQNRLRPTALNAYYLTEEITLRR